MLAIDAETEAQSNSETVSAKTRS